MSTQHELADRVVEAERELAAAVVANAPDDRIADLGVLVAARAALLDQQTSSQRS
jgi:hypothetical protein